MSKLKRVSLLTAHCSLLCVLCVFAVNREAIASDWSFTPSATLSETYDSNFRFVSTPGPGTTKDDFITNLSPVVSITGETEQTKFQFDTVTSGLAYLENPKFDIVNTNTTASLTESWSPRFSTSLNLGFIHDTTLESSLLASGIVTPMTERYFFSFGLGGKYDLSESLNLTASGVFAKTIYPLGGETFPDSDVFQGTITPVWAISPRDNIGLSSNFSYVDYSTATTIKTLTETLFWERPLTEDLSLKLSGGYYFTTIDFTTQELVIILFPLPPHYGFLYIPATSNDSGPIFGADLKKDWSERFSTTFSAGSQQYNDALARSFDSMFISGTATYKLSERTTANFLARYNTNDQISQGSLKIDYYILTASIERNLTENLLIRLAGSYECESQTNPSLNVDRYRTWIDLTYKWPRFFSSH